MSAAIVQNQQLQTENELKSFVNCAKDIIKKILLENFQWYKKQHEKEIAAWRLGCSTILMLLEILWVFYKYLPQPCFPEWHENKEIIQRDVKTIFPSIKNSFIIFIIIIAIGNSLSFWQISVTALLPEKRNYTKTGNHTELSNVYFSQNPKYDTFKLNILILFVYWQCLLLNLDFSSIKITLHCNSFNICCCGTGLAFLLSGSSESSTVKTVKTCFHKKVLSLLVIAVITSSHISISTSFSVNLWHNQYSKLIYVLIYLVHYHFQSFCCHFKKDQTLVESYIHWTLTLRDQNFLTEGTRKV